MDFLSFSIAAYILTHKERKRIKAEERKAKVPKQERWYHDKMMMVILITIAIFLLSWLVK